MRGRGRKSAFLILLEGFKSADVSFWERRLRVLNGCGANGRTATPDQNGLSSRFRVDRREGEFEMFEQRSRRRVDCERKNGSVRQRKRVWHFGDENLATGYVELETSIGSLLGEKTVTMPNHSLADFESSYA